MTLAISQLVQTPVRVAPNDQASRLRAIAENAGRSRPVERAAGRRVKVVTIGSGKGGVGKTAIAVNLAIALRRRGVRVTVVDADLGTANVDVVCGLSPTRRLDHALRASVAHGNPVDLASCSSETPLGFRLVAGIAGMARGADLGPSERWSLADGLATLDSEADLVIVDVGAGIGSATRTLMHAADLPLIVATPEPASIADAYGLLKSLRMDGLDSPSVPHLVLNQVGSTVERDTVHARLNAVARRFLKVDLPLAGSVSWDRDALVAARVRTPILALTGKSPSRKDLLDLARFVMLRVDLASDEPAKPARRWWPGARSTD